MSECYKNDSISCVLDQRSIYLRRLIVDALCGGGRGHVGAALSLVEIMRVLYDSVLNVSPDKASDPSRDRLILSKGHGCLALYVMLYEKGFITQHDLENVCKHNALLGGHPEHFVPGVEASTGALGHGLAMGVGMALAGRINKTPYSVYVVMGDGEINEGSVWESALSASKQSLNNLFVLIDYNKMQSYSTTKEVLDLEPLADKWKAFGFAVDEANGHDVKQLQEKLTRSLHGSKPRVLICHTVKGKGISFAENNLKWHHKSKLTETEVESLYGELV